MSLFRENNILYNVETPTLEGPSFLPFDSLKIPALRLADQHNLDLTGKQMRKLKKGEKLSFSMVDTLTVHRNDVKCSKLKWNHNLQVSGLIAKFWTTYFDIISVVYESVEQWKFVLYNNFISFYCPFPFSKVSWQKIAPERQKNNGLYSNIHSSSRPISAREIAQLL